jgi:hypothetical protein
MVVLRSQLKSKGHHSCLGCLRFHSARASFSWSTKTGSGFLSFSTNSRADFPCRKSCSSVILRRRLRCSSRSKWPTAMLMGQSLTHPLLPGEYLHRLAGS